jgi:ABC-type glycerol-3-phosphate transport system substrate-binding protein
MAGTSPAMTAVALGQVENALGSSPNKIGESAMLHRTRILLTAAGLATAAMIGSANAAEIQFLGSTAMREALDELVPHFEKASGHKVVMNLYPAATLVAKVKDGAPADIVMTTPDNLAERGRSIWSTAPGSISRMRGSASR